jgi:hypothetical protein
MCHAVGRNGIAVGRDGVTYVLLSRQERCYMCIIQ